MEKLTAELLKHVAKAHEELARILKSTRDISMHTADHIVGTLPDHHLTFGAQDVILTHALDLTANVTAFLNSLGDLQEALADSLEPVIEQIQTSPAEE